MSKILTKSEKSQLIQTVADTITGYLAGLELDAMTGGLNHQDVKLHYDSLTGPDLGAAITELLNERYTFAKRSQSLNVSYNYKDYSNEDE